MPFDWSNYKSLAEELRLVDNEASKRSAISRVYYSVFHLAKRHLIDTGNFQYSEFKDPHAQVWNEFVGKGKTHNAIGVNGKRLRTSRNDADYKDEILKFDDFLEASFRTANSVLTYLQQIQKESN